MIEILETLNSLERQLEDKQEEIEKGSLPYRLIRFAIRNVGHIRRNCQRIDKMLAPVKETKK